MNAIPLRIRATDVGALVRSHMTVMQAQAAAANVSLTVSLAPDLPAALNVDAEKLGWAMTTLVGNAIRYLGHATRQRPGGSIVVVARYDAAIPAVVIEVRDNGPGIVEATVSRLFNHDDPRGPSGLALLLVHDIVEAHGGHVDVRSSTAPEHSGTTIRLTVPATTDGAPGRSSRARRPQRSRRRPHR